MFTCWAQHWQIATFRTFCKLSKNTSVLLLFLFGDSRGNHLLDGSALQCCRSCLTKWCWCCHLSLCDDGDLVSVLTTEFIFLQHFQLFAPIPLFWRQLNGPKIHVMDFCWSGCMKQSLCDRCWKDTSLVRSMLWHWEQCHACPSQADDGPVFWISEVVLSSLQAQDWRWF